MTEAALPLRPLQGLKVLDFSRVLSGPFCTMTLADLGADVIKVEDIGDGDTTRHFAPYINGESHYFMAINRNKKGISLDLKSEEGRKIAHELAAQSDVVIENFRPGVAERLGLGFDTLSELNPKLIYASISGFGQDSSEKNKTAYDLVIQALTGAMDITGENGRLPAKMGIPVADQVSGLFAGIAILGSLERREQTGKGARIDISMFDVGVALLSYMANAYLGAGSVPKRLGSSHPTIYPYNAFRTKDGFITVAPFTNAFWRKFCKVLGLEEMGTSEKYRNFGGRLKNRGTLAPILEEIMLTRTTAEWVGAIEKGDVPCGPVNTIGQALAMDQTAARQMVRDIDHPVAGKIRMLGSPFHFNFEGARSYEAPYDGSPGMGEHSRQVLAERLGRSADDIENLIGQGVVRTLEVERRSDAAPVEPAVTNKSRDTTAPADTPPLAGIRVLDLTRMLAGPYCGLLMADMGAEVIKVEERGIGDPTRVNLPLIDGHSTYFMSVNRGKRSVAIDLKSAEGRQVLLDLVAKSDIVIENFRAGVMDRLGLGYDELRKVKKDIILCSISGFGQTGPMREKISFDLVNQAMSGCMAVTGEEGREPVRIGLPIGDLSGGYFGAISILAALRARRKFGCGSHIDLGIHDLLLYQLGYLAQLHFTTGEDPTPVGSGHHHIAPYRAYAASDGLFVVAAFTQAIWLKFAAGVNDPRLNAPEYATMADRKTNMVALNQLLDEIFAGQTVNHWVSVFEKSDVPAAEINSIKDAIEAPLSAERGLVFDVEHPAVGVVKTISTALRVDGELWRNPTGAELLGQSTDIVLQEVVGYAQDKLDALTEAGVIGVNEERERGMKVAVNAS